MLDIQLSPTPLDPAICEAFVTVPEAGGIVVFMGTVRNLTQGRAVQRLEFEAYERMALQEMRRIAEEVLTRFDALRVSLHHRVGVVEVGGLAVIIAVAAPHRAAAFGACQFCIDTLKERVPIWKKEVFEDGEMWVSAHP